MVQVLGDQLQPDPLGQALGLGLQSAVGSFMQQKQRTEEREGLRSLGEQLGLPQEHIDAFSQLSPDLAKTAIGAFAQQKARPEEKPSIIETEQLKKLGESSSKLPGRLRDIDRGIELINEGVMTGPAKGFAADWITTLSSGKQQEFKGIASRLLTGSFSTLPRISNEFESFKSGQISLRNKPEVNLRLLESNKLSSLLEQKNLNRIAELQEQGFSEKKAFNIATKESKKEEEEILKQIQSERKTQTKKSKENIKKSLFG